MPENQYGEPWSLKGAEVVHYNEQRNILLDPDDYERACACVNALASFADDALPLAGEIEQLRKLEKFVRDLISESRGVEGFHLNGDIADWDEFEDMSQALSALDAIRAQKESGT